MQKKDYNKELKQLYRTSAKKVVLVDVPEMNWASVFSFHQWGVVGGSCAS